MRTGKTFRLGWLVALAAVGCTACSFLIDVEPNCDAVSTCVPYTCNDDNTACRAFCLDDTHCASGFVCDPRGTEACVDTGCVPTGPPVALFTLAGSGLEFDSARSGESFWVIVATSDGVGLTQVNPDGTVVGGASGLVPLDPDPALPAEPLAIGTELGPTVFWRGQPDDNRFDLRVFHRTSDGTGQGPNVVYSGRTGQSLDDPAVARLGEDIGVVWSTFGERVQVELLPLNLDGTFGPDNETTAPNDAAIRLTESTVGASLPGLAATADRFALARRQTSVGASGVVVSFLDSTFSPITDHLLSAAQAVGIDAVHAAGLATAVASIWLETQEDEVTLQRAVDGVNGIILGAQSTQDFSREPREPHLAAGTAEFAAVWVGQTDAGSDVFMRRFNETGGGLFVTFSVTGRTAAEPARPRAVRTADGYGVFWVEASADPATLMFRRFVCAR